MNNILLKINATLAREAASGLQPIQYRNGLRKLAMDFSRFSNVFRMKRHRVECILRI